MRPLPFLVSSIKNQMNSNKHHLWKHLPTVGILLFAVLYVYSASLYPGGSQMNLDSVGFDWVNNYWCDLMHFESANGQPNPAEPYAVFAMILLCISVLAFFFRVSNILIHNKKWRLAIQISGTLSMLFAALIFTRFHNQMIILASLFGLIPVFGIIRGIARSDLFFYKITSLICILLLFLNNLLYYTDSYLNILPLLQKITFVIVLLWVIGLNQEMNKRSLLAPSKNHKAI